MASSFGVGAWEEPVVDLRIKGLNRDGAPICCTWKLKDELIELKGVEEFKISKLQITLRCNLGLFLSVLLRLRKFIASLNLMKLSTLVVKPA